MPKRKLAFIRDDKNLTESEMMQMFDMSDEDTDDSVEDRNFVPSSEGKIPTICQYK